MKRHWKTFLSMCLSVSIILSMSTAVFATPTNVSGGGSTNVSGGDNSSSSGGGHNNNRQPDEEPFDDVTRGDWYYDDVVYVYKNELMAGTSENLFSPHAPLTRGMTATILYRYAGSLNVDYEPIFTDVPDGQWYTDGVMWAVQEGIMVGYGDNTCGPEDSVKLEQLAAILYRYAGSPDVDVDEDKVLSEFPGGTDVTPYAEDAMQWALQNDMIYGNSMLPTAGATRAQAAKMFAVFAQMEDTSEA